MNTYFSTGIDEIFVVRGGRWNLKLVLAKIKLNNSSSISIQFLTKAFCNSSSISIQFLTKAFCID